MFESNDDFFDKNEVSGIKPTSNDHPSFKPWHKPRKQFVRENQWWSAINQLVTRYSNHYESIPTIRYFGLPGGDLLDVQYIKEKLSSTTKNLLVHGFISNPEDKCRADSRIAVLTDDPNIHEESRVDRFNFASLETQNSISWSRIKEIGPYHFINLDFCDGIFKAQTLSSMMLLLNYQIQRFIETPWMFCLTTRVDRNGVNRDLFDKLESVLENLNAEAILELLENQFSDAFTVVTQAMSLSDDSLSDAKFSEILQICVVIWVVLYALNHGCRISLISSCKYKVDPSSTRPDMFSFVFRLRKSETVIPDETGLASPDFSPALEADERLDLQRQALSRLSESLDVDAHLESNSTVHRQCAKKMEELLTVCGWDVSDYMDQVCPDLI